MTRDEAAKYLIDISYKFGNISVEYLTEKDGEKMREAINVLTNEQQMCEDAVSRQAVLEGIRNLYPDIPIVDFMSARRKWLEKYAPYFECEKVVEQLPPVNPQPKIGHWEWVRYDSNPNIGNWHCSECRTIIPRMSEETDNTPIYKVCKQYRFCPNCGTKMF